MSMQMGNDGGIVNAICNTAQRQAQSCHAAQLQKTNNPYATSINYLVAQSIISLMQLSKEQN